MRGDLDVAWAEAESALLPGHTMDLVLENHVDRKHYLAWTTHPLTHNLIKGEGTTPAAALRALAEKLTNG